MAKNKKITFGEFQKSRVEMTTLEYCKKYFFGEKVDDYFADNIHKLYVYLNGAHIEIVDNSFGILIGNTHEIKETLPQAEKHLWDNFAKYECFLTEEEKKEEGREVHI